MVSASLSVSKLDQPGEFVQDLQSTHLGGTIEWSVPVCPSPDSSNLESSFRTPRATHLGRTLQWLLLPVCPFPGPESFF